ncbi:NlpC/P60 family protein [Streptomyces sp. 4N509B]|uniref:NlpC/P60 family protein n=1 Tax=Streptomyces sp. 4N509B TaxID=3457413 RepID=UPI003FD2B3F2
MAKHRKPKRRPHPLGAFRPRGSRRPHRALRSVAATLTLAGAASTTLVDGVALAEPEPSLPAIRERVDALHREAEEATERYNAATEEVDRAQEAIELLQDEAARHTELLDEARDALGGHAAAQYRDSHAGLPPSLQLALSSDPDDFLDAAVLADLSGDLQAEAVAEVHEQLRAIEQLRGEADVEAEALAEARDVASEEREEVRERLAEAEELLATRTEEERERILLGGSPDAAGAAQGVVPSAPGSGGDGEAVGRAAAAVAFAHAQLGKPYVWGGTGPDGFDCSGLTQAAWAAAGVALPRTSYAQVGSGTPVALSELAPGDLVFYYAGLSHVGIYVGGGQVIHASRPGAPIAFAPVDSMPVAAATRPA